MRKLGLVLLALAALSGARALAENASEIALTPMPPLMEEWEYGEVTEPFWRAQAPDGGDAEIDPTAVPQKGPAATRAMAQLLSTPQPGAKVLMTYYPGVRVQVVRQADTEYVQVNVGNRPGTLTGYMRAEDLAFTEAGVRSIQPALVNWMDERWWEEPDTQPHVYSYMDELSQDMGLYGLHSVLGVSEDGWLHVIEKDGEPSGATGFVYRGAETGVMVTGEMPYIYTLPAQDELPFDEAIEWAKATMLADGALDYSNEPVTQQWLDRCTVRIHALTYPDGTLMYNIEFRYNLCDESTSEDFYAGITLYVEGKTVLRHSYGKG